MSYQLYYKNKRKPDDQGEGRAVAKEDAAYKICKQSNELFPGYHHWYELVDKTQNNKEDGTRN